MTTKRKTKTLSVYRELLHGMLTDSTVRDAAREWIAPDALSDDAVREVFEAICSVTAPELALDLDEEALLQACPSDAARALIASVKAMPSRARMTQEEFEQLLTGIRRAEPVHVSIRRLADVEQQPIHWLWPGRIPIGKLTVLEGDPGLGKSTLTVELAARVSTGTPLTDAGRGEPADVLFLSYEDDAADTIKPRLVAAGGDAARVHVIDGVCYNGGPQKFLSFPDDIPALRKVITETRARLVIIDPLTNALGAGVDFYVDPDVRKALAPLGNLAQELQVAVVLVRHYTQGPARNAVTAGGGSMGIAGIARVVLAVHADPENPEFRVLAVVKCNVAQHAPSLSFELTERDGYPAIRWRGVSNLSANDLVAARSGDSKRERRTEAEAFLLDALASGPMEKMTVVAAAEARGISAGAIQRASAKIDVGLRKEYGGPGIWFLKEAARGTPTANLRNLSNLSNLCTPADRTLSEAHGQLAGGPAAETMHPSSVAASGKEFEHFENDAKIEKIEKIAKIENTAALGFDFPPLKEGECTVIF